MDKLFIKGKFKKILYQATDSSYIVALFRVKETNDKDMKEYLNKTITASGQVPNFKIDANYILNGTLKMHPKYSWQYVIDSFELEKPTTLSSITDFLSSPFVEGCGDATAKKIVDMYGIDSINKIKEDINNLMVIKGMTPTKASKIYMSVMNYEKNDLIVSKLQSFGFSLEESSKILTKHNMDIDAVIEGNLYLLKDLFDFKKIDDIYINNFDKESPLRIKECIISSMESISFNEGSTYYDKEKIYQALSVLYNLNIDSETFDDYLLELQKNDLIVHVNDNYYLSKYYNEERNVANILYLLSQCNIKKISNIEDSISKLEKKLGITYNEEQKRAIENSLNNNITIISGGPGTGKTTIIKAITEIYINEYNLDATNIMSNIALLAPTGRASKKMSISTGLPAYTIHRFLKWHKETDTFEFNEDNKIPHKLIIVDETSMIDISLMNSLLSALNYNVRLVLVGDIYQLPSVGPGHVLSDLISSDLFSFNPLTIIYRQSDNSYIPFLAKDIKMQNIDDDFMYKRDDYSFITCNEEEILNKVASSCKYALSKGINEDNLQVLAPMYKGVNGIDNLNNVLQKIYNPESNDKSEIKYGDKIYREKDKVLQLINDSDNQVFNGDIGKIIFIGEDHHHKLIIRIDFDGNIVTFEKKDLKNITLAYAISIHKSQGSEFEHVIMPISKNYFVMLYNKLLYTGVSRAKKSLTIIGDPRSFTYAIGNNYSSERKTFLKEFLMERFHI